MPSSPNGPCSTGSTTSTRPRAPRRAGRRLGAGRQLRESAPAPGRAGGRPPAASAPPPLDQHRHDVVAVGVERLDHRARRTSARCRAPTSGRRRARRRGRAAHAHGQGVVCVESATVSVDLDFGFTLVPAGRIGRDDLAVRRRRLDDRHLVDDLRGRRRPAPAGVGLGRAGRPAARRARAAAARGRRDHDVTVEPLHARLAGAGVWSRSPGRRARVAGLVDARRTSSASFSLVAAASCRGRCTFGHGHLPPRPARPSDRDRRADLARRRARPGSAVIVPWVDGGRARSSREREVVQIGDGLERLVDRLALQARQRDGVRAACRRRSSPSTPLSASLPAGRVRLDRPCPCSRSSTCAAAWRTSKPSATSRCVRLLGGQPRSASGTLATCVGLALLRRDQVADARRAGEQQDAARASHGQRGAALGAARRLAPAAARGGATGVAPVDRGHHLGRLLAASARPRAPRRDAPPRRRSRSRAELVGAR